MNVASVIQAVASLSWLAFIAIIVVAVTRASRGRPLKAATTLILVIGIMALALSSVSAGLVFIQPDERGVVISAVNSKGIRETGLTPGLRWIVPFFENVVRYPISRQTYTMSIAPLEGQVQGDDSVTARTADGQEIFIDASVIYAIDPNKVVQVHVTWQDRYADDLVRPLSRGVIRDEVAQLRVEEVVSSKRTQMSTDITQNLTKKLAENGLVLVDFVLRNVTFSPEYAASVEQKQIAEQLAQQAAFIVQQRKQEAEQARQVAEGKADAVVIEAEGSAKARVINAKAEAEALQLIADALKDNPDLLTFEYIDKLSPGIQVMLVPNDTPYLLPLPSLDPSVLAGPSQPGGESTP